MFDISNKQYKNILPPIFKEIKEMNQNFEVFYADQMFKNQCKASQIRNFYKQICGVINFYDENFEIISELHSCKRME